MLILGLPSTLDATVSGYGHVRARAGEAPTRTTAAAATLPLDAGEWVAVVPASRLLWVTLDVPPNSHGARLMPVLHALLEERLLQDAAQQHIVLPPDAAARARAGGPMTLCLCERAWLREALAPLRAAGHTVHRIVPEFTPTPSPSLHILGGAEQRQAVLCHAQGVQVLPPDTAAWEAFTALRDPALQVWAEPAWLDMAQRLQAAQVTLQTGAERWVRAAEGAWNLAQGEWAQGPRQRLWRRAHEAWQALWHAPQWRAMRWGALALVAVQLLGLNLLAWREQQQLSAQRAALRTLLTDTFPKTSLVIDAPLQMQREVDALLRSRGDPSRSDFEWQLAALAEVLPAGHSPQRIDYADQRLQVQGLSLPPDAPARLRARGFTLQQEGAHWSVRPAGATP